jgi:peptidylprolyl isomerase
MRSPRLRVSRAATLLIASALAIAACGEDTIDDGSQTSTAATDAVAAPDISAPVSAAPSAGAADKPAVEIPSELPTKLVVTDLTEGTGDPAEMGDTVVVDYVGVRSVDGTEFDNSYDAGEPFPVTLGETSVIQGWTDGLVGVKQGGRRQLDIPTDLAYGDSPSGDIIQPGDALTFVVDVVAVIGVSDPADAPAITVEAAENQEEMSTEDLVVGDGDVVQAGQTVAIQLIAFRADTGEQIASTWEDGGTPFQFVLGNGEVLPGIELALEGMAVGGRRQAMVPFLMAYGDTGNGDLGLPAATDMVLVIDLINAY